MKSTGKPISKEFAEILYKLEDTNTPLDETFMEMLYEVPEIKDGMEKLYEHTNTRSLNRKEMWLAWANELLLNNGFANKEEVVYNGDVEKGHKAFLVLGLPASGKSSVITDRLLKENKAILLDSDEAKKIIPEYDNGWGAGAVHEESKEVNKRLIRNVIENYDGANVVMPIVGDTVPKVSDYMDVFKEAGYSVSLHLVEVSVRTSLSRMLKRFIEDNRFINPEIVFNYSNKPSIVFEKMKEEADEYVKWSNEVKRGEKPVLVYQGESKDFSRGMEERGRAGGETGQGTTPGDCGSQGEQIALFPKAEVVYDIPWQIELKQELVEFARFSDYYSYIDSVDNDEEALEQMGFFLKTTKSIEDLKEYIEFTVSESDDPEIQMEGMALISRLDDLINNNHEKNSIDREMITVKYQLYQKLKDCDLYFDSESFDAVFKAFEDMQVHRDVVADGKEIKIMTSGFNAVDLDNYLVSENFDEAVCNNCRLEGKLK